MEKFKSFVTQYLLVTGAVLTGLWAYEYLNKPKTAPPATAPATTEKE